MRTYLPFILIFAIFSFQPKISSSEEPSEHPVIIDTDCAPDDFRAINYFLSDRDVEILAITSEDGVMEPEEGYLKIKAMLKNLGHEGIRSSKGIITKNEVPEWRTIAESIKWGEPLISYSEPTEVKEFLVKMITEEKRKVDIVCMGPLTNVANAVLMRPAIKKKIHRIIWFDQCEPGNKWTNYGMDCLSADYLLETDIPVYRIKAGKKTIDFNRKLLEKIGKINSPYAHKIYQTHTSDSILDKINKKHFKIWDDLTALFYFYPELFETSKAHADTMGNILQLKKNNKIHDKILNMLEKYYENSRTTLKEVPTDTSHYQKDLAPHVKEIINRHGIKEWEAAILAHEMHHHLGLYSTIGVKMGIRALDYFRAHPGDLEIISHCGTKPPTSCMNDGLQVATGSTVGNGSFHLGEPELFPEIKATHNNQTIVIKLKNDIYKNLKNIIQEGKEKYGFQSEKYWSFIREKSISQWKELDRNSIFQIDRK
jgi:pyrimidine-specific ribonucleoside hydrolase